MVLKHVFILLVLVLRPRGCGTCYTMVVMLSNSSMGLHNLCSSLSCFQWSDISI
uniref:Uncharacterized protein n=1 Tax=Arundo donax TaxID=35708 RepID=A0A0A9EKQ0_ARUDO